MRSIFDFSRENTKIADWLADDAVWCEPVSDEVGLMMEGLFNRSATSVYMGLPKELILAPAANLKPPEKY
jgi:hypothetical protein